MASTVALVKNSESGDGIEILLMKRNMNDRFLPGYHVFPGGAVEDQDAHGGSFFKTHHQVDLLSSEEEQKKIITHMMCAIRETFEESGILLAESDGKYFDMNTHNSNEKFSEYRKLIFKGEIELPEMMKNEKLTPSFRNINYLTRWITPPFSPIRYDTRFFVALSPENQMTSHDGNELVTSEWLNPQKALQLYKKGTMKLVSPTISTLEFLGKFRSAEEVESYFFENLVISPARSF